MVKRIKKLKVNSVVKAVILAEMLLWSAWNFIMPIFSIYITNLPNGSVEKAASSFSVYLLSRVVFGLLSGRYLSKRRTRHKFMLMIVGMILLSISYIGLAYSPTIESVYFFYGLIGLALGMASPAKNSLFSTNVNKEKSTFIWSVLDAGVFLSMAVAAILGGMIAEKLGFQILFFLAAIINFVAIIPYLLYIRYFRKTTDLQSHLLTTSSSFTDIDSCDDELADEE